MGELKFRNPVSIGIDTFFMSGGLPETFLKGAGVPDVFIDYGQSMTALSEHSLSSQWVETEVEAAFERERIEVRDVLFPIRLDQAILHSEVAWAMAIRRTRQIGDFSGWRKKSSYAKSFDLLCRSLRRNPAAS